MKPILIRQATQVCFVFALTLTSCTQIITPISVLPPTEIPSTVIPTNILPVSSPTSTLAPTSVPEFQKGIVYTSWWNGEYSSPESDKTISERIKPLGVNWLSIVVTCYQEEFNSTAILCDETKTPTDSDLNHVIQYAHSLGLKVMLKPHVDLSNDSEHWRGDIGFGDDETAWKAWFESYTRFITHYAILAQSESVDYFVIGTELKNTSRRSDDWLKIIGDVKQEYRGPLTYAANHDGEEFNIDWWDKLDAIGVDAYYPLTKLNNPTVAQIKEAWAPVIVNLGDLSKKWNRSIIFTEVGYQSRDGINQTPWNAESETTDLQEQADCYQALFEAFAEQEWWQGVFWWNWTTISSQGGSLDNDFTANNKPAESVLIQNYSGTPRPTPTPAPVLTADENNQLVVYSDDLNGGWEDWSWDSTVDLASSDKVQNGDKAIKISINKPWGALSLHNPKVDTSNYYWLEFYINVGENMDRKLVVSVNNESDTELPQLVDVSMYIEGNSFTANQWQKVLIPIADLGASEMIITRINIKDNSGNGQEDFLIDEIKMIGAK